MDGKLVCPLCSREFSSLSSHVLRIHKMSIVEFRGQFPKQQMVSDDVKQRTSATSKATGVGKWRKGSKLTSEHKEWLSQKNTGAGNPFFGRHHTDETRVQMVLNHADVTGDNNPFRRAMRDEQYRTGYIQRRKIAWEDTKQNDPERYARKCDSASRATTQAFLDGKLVSYGRGHKHGWYTSPKAFEPIYYRSSYEARFLELCDLSDAVKTVTSVSYNISYTDEDERPRKYIPDFIVNNSVLIEVKARFALDNERVQRKHHAAERYCEKHGMRFIVITSPVDEQFNLLIVRLCGQAT